jgi:hypothetical protein
MRTNGGNAFRWAEAAALNGDRHGMYQLAYHCHYGFGCAKDGERAARLFLQAADLGDCTAQWSYGEWACGEFDWLRYHWWLVAASRGYVYFGDLVPDVMRLLPLFEKGEKGRILHLFAPLLMIGLDADNKTMFGNTVSRYMVRSVQRVFLLHDAMLARARRAIACWSMAGRRLGIVKDMRVMIAKAAWEEPWRWGEKEAEEQTNKSARKDEN